MKRSAEERRLRQISRGQLTYSNGLVFVNTTVKCDSHGKPGTAVVTARLLGKHSFYGNLSERGIDNALNNSLGKTLSSATPQQIMADIEDIMKRVWK